jgi:hypothetical protein
MNVDEDVKNGAGENDDLDGLALHLRLASVRMKTILHIGTS